MTDPASTETGGASAQPVSLGEATRLWAKVGCLSFGGAAGQIAMLHRLVVDERRWLDERSFLNALNFCTLLPGPEAQQLATYMGWRLHGVVGGLIAGALFVVPGALVMFALALLYGYGQGLAVVEGLFLGIKAAVLAIVAEALHRIGKRALKSRTLVAMAVASFVAIVVLDVPFPAVVGVAALIGALASRAAPAAFGIAERPPAPAGAQPGAAGALLAAGACLLAWWAPVLLAAVTLGPGHLLVDLGLFFSKLAVVTFGGAYAVLAYLADAAVEVKGWVTTAEMVDGLGLAETTPGPTILVNQFVGTLAALRNPAPFGPVAAAALGSLMTVWVTFLPSFVWIFAGAPSLERIVGNPRLAGALAAITAAVVGVVASLAVTFGLQVLFAEVASWRLGPVRLPWPALASLRPDMLLLSVVSAVLLFRFHFGVVRTVAVMAVAGLGLSLLR
ncbi:MAG TPA: chromate efflux transporter [Microvirga sp.]|jgi:chromate transporter